MESLRICLVSAEVSPFAKTGGLGDVTAALARYLARAGHDVRLFFPLYAGLDRGIAEIGRVDYLQELQVDFSGTQIGFSGSYTWLPESGLQIYLIDCPRLYDRNGLYRDDGDEHLRFAMLSRAALACCQAMGWSPQIVHCNDWHTALIPLYLKTLYGWDSIFRSTRSVLTLHNVGYQGVFAPDVIPDLGLAQYRGLFDQDDLAAGQVNFLKTGILHADVLTTVSPTHAIEIQTPEYGMGLDPLLRQRGDRLLGILNGVDYGEWNPADDSLIPHQFTADDLSGKERNKASLLGDLSLGYEPGVPAVGIVSRLVGQKGIDLYFEALPAALNNWNMRLVVLGSGESRYESFFTRLQGRFPDRVCFWRGFNNELAHRIEAGCDMFLMPSLYEPCGLNQMYSQRYGTVPIVRRTGGLADSVEPWDWERRTGTGFVFEDYSPAGLLWALEAALETYQHQDSWLSLVRAGMARDFSWDHQVQRYVDLYRRLVS